MAAVAALVMSANPSLMQSDVLTVIINSAADLAAGVENSDNASPGVEFVAPSENEEGTGVLGMQVRAMANCAVQHPARCPAVGTCDRWHPAPSICVPRHRIQRAILTPKPVIRFVRQHQGHDRQGWWQGSYQISRSTVRPTLGRPLGVSGFFTF